jgi:ABC-type bacteriocin/lantibiotic exporter with double-glycine peptidase domain
LTENSIGYEELEERVKKFLGYERKLHFLANGTSWFIFPVTIPFVILSLLGYTVTWQVLPVFIITSSIWFLSAFWLRKRVITYSVQDNEWATFYCHSIVESLTKRSKARTNQLKREYQREATKYAEDFISCIN